MGFNSGFKALMHKIGMVQSSLIFVNNQLDAQFFYMYVYFCSLHVSGSHVPVIRRTNCINMTSGICYSVQMTIHCAVSSKPAHQTVIYTEWHIPDVVLIQLILLIWCCVWCKQIRSKNSILSYRITTRSRCILSLWDSLLWITVSSFLRFYYLLVTWWWPGDRGRNMLSPCNLK